MMRRRSSSGRWLGGLVGVLLLGGATVAGCFFTPEESYPSDQGQPPCTPGATEACYSGPAGTEGQGVCHGGTRSCAADGRWGACEGEVVPAVSEDCGTEADEDCDGTGWGPMAAGCACIPGEVVPCYTGPAGTEGRGACHGGTWMCGTSGLGFGPCVGEVLPVQMDVCGDDVLDEDCDGATCGGDVVWAIEAGGTGAQYAYDVAVDSDGNVVVAGVFQGEFSIGTTTFTSQGTDGFLLKLDAEGELIWVKHLHGVGEQIVRSVAVDSSGNVYFTGDFDQSLNIDPMMPLTTTEGGDIDFFVGKLDALGNVLWMRDFGTDSGNNSEDDQMAYGIAVAGADNVAVTGRFNGIVTFDGVNDMAQDADVGNVGFDIFVARIGAGGAVQWFKSFGVNNAFQGGEKVAYESAIHVIGTGAGTFDVGTTSLNNGTGTDILALRFDPTSGAGTSGVNFGTAADDDARGLDIALDADGNVLLTGYYDGEINFGNGVLTSTGQSRFVIKRASDGMLAWAKGFPAATSLSSTSIGGGVAADSAGNVLLTGHFSGTTNLGGADLTAEGTDVYVAKLAADGTHLWSRRFGNQQQQYGVAVAADPTDHAVVVGNFLGQLDFGITTLNANGPSTLFVAKLAP